MPRKNKSRSTSTAVSFVVWLTGVLVSLAVGFGMIDQSLTIPKMPGIITVMAGWIVVILTILSIILAIADRV